MSKYESYTEEQTKKHLESFLVDTWSYSMLTAFARNEKAFEMRYIYGQKGKSSATTVAGSAYHFALDRYFTAVQNGSEQLFDIVDLQQFASEYIEERPAFIWKIQKTTPTVEDCRQKAITTANELIENFFKEIDIYTNDDDKDNPGELRQILDVEVSFDEYLTVSGVDIPIRCRGVLDKVCEFSNGKNIIIDHKSKSAYSNEEEVKLSSGIQAMTYVLGYEKKTGVRVDEVWFIENKHSKNSDGSNQLRKSVVVINDSSRKLYEFLLYENIKRVISAITDPDYIYLINNSDKLSDAAELYDFWCKTMMVEIGENDFNVPENKKELIGKRLKKIRDANVNPIDQQTIKQFKEHASAFITYDFSNKNMSPSEKIEHVLSNFKKFAKVKHIFSGYSSDTYLLDTGVGVKVSSIQYMKLDIANALDVENVRIANNLVVHDKKSYLSIESAKERTDTLMWTESDLVDMKIPIGKDNFGNTIVWDLNNHSTPHVLIGGATGSGKSVCIKSTIMYAKKAGIKEIYILDPKHEFIHLSGPNINVVNEVEDIEAVMALLVENMNDKVRSGATNKVLVIFDEFADAIANSRKGKVLGQDKSLEENLRLLLQKGRSSGFRIMAGTQRASTKIISGDAKVNFPVQICFRVPKEVDSKVMIDEAGAEALGGMGDGLIKSPQYKDTVRFQGYYHS